MSATFNLTANATQVPLTAGNQFMIVENLGTDFVYYRAASNVSTSANDGEIAPGQRTQFYTGPQWFVATASSQILVTYFPVPTDPGAYATLAQLGAVNVLNPTYGAKGDGVTDDTTAIQAAYNAAQALAATTGQAALVFPSGYTFKYQRINTTTGGVDIWAYGSKHIPTGTALTSGMYLPAFGSTVSRFAIRGGTWAGTGSESQPLFFGGNGDAVVDVLFRDMYITGWGVGPLYMYNVQRAITTNNTILNTTGTLNCINHVFGGTATVASQIVSHGNIIQNCTGGAIAIVQDAASNPPANFEVQATISDNICDGATFQLAGSIDIEADSATAAAYGRIVISGNHVTNRTPSGNAFGITAEAEFADVIIANNTVKVISSSGFGVLASGAAISVVNNRINAANTFFTSPTQVLRSGNILSSGPSQGRATLVAGTVTVSTAEVQAADNILLSRVVSGGTTGQLSVGTITAGTSFVINSSSGTDTSTIYWRIDH